MNLGQPHDPLEGVASDGAIVTGVRLDRVSTLFQPVVDAAAAATAAHGDASLYLYGSVATGMAIAPQSDVDLLTFGLDRSAAAMLGGSLSQEFGHLCRGVDVAGGRPEDFAGDDDEAYGNRVFLRHYCVHVIGPDLHSALPTYPADARAARGFNGDIARHAERWRSALSQRADPLQLGRRVARKTLLAVAGLISVHDGTWTTDRTHAAHRWAEVEPRLASDLDTLLLWSNSTETPGAARLEAVLDGVVPDVVGAFAVMIGLWPGADAPAGS